MSEQRPSTRRSQHFIAVWWAVIGTALLFAQAVVQLGTRGVALMVGGLSALEWVALLALTLTFVWGEGIHALQRRWVPYMVQRADQLRDDPRLLMRVLAPLYAMSLIGAPMNVLARSWLGVAAIVMAVIAVRLLPHPWRGMIDFAVAAALAWALMAIVLRSWRSLRRPKAGRATHA